MFRTTAPPSTSDDLVDRHVDSIPAARPEVPSTASCDITVHLGGKFERDTTRVYQYCEYKVRSNTKAFLVSNFHVRICMCMCVLISNNILY